jgi:formylglycine-generating enzyme required for sulfatase activity
MEFVKIKAGSFLMGSPEDEKGRYDREVFHKVTITRDYYIQTTEVTQGQWYAVMGTRPWEGKPNVIPSDLNPAVYVSWKDCQAFISKLNELENTDSYRLPTEAEWEYACKAAAEGPYGYDGPVEELSEYAWYDENTIQKEIRHAQAVALKKPNLSGLFDMNGNVWEWCADYYTKDLGKKAVEDPAGPPAGSGRVLKGGGFIFPPRDCRCSNRYYNMSAFKDFVLGFRLARSLD